MTCFLWQVTGKKVDGREMGDFLPEDFKNGEYEAAVRLEKQEDLKTLTDHSLTRRNLTYKEEKELQAEVKKTWLQGLFYFLIWLFCLTKSLNFHCTVRKYPQQL